MARPSTNRVFSILRCRLRRRSSCRGRRAPRRAGLRRSRASRTRPPAAAMQRNSERSLFPGARGRLLRACGEFNEHILVYVMQMKAESRELLKGVSTATLTTVLFKRGFRNVFIQGVFLLNKNSPRMVGEAFTLRYIPAREDIDLLG